MGTYADREGIICLRLEDQTNDGYGVDPSASADPYGTGAIGVVDPSSADAIYVEDPSIKGSRTSIARTGPSPYEHGYMPVAGPADVGFSAKLELAPQTLTATPVIADIPRSLDAGLRCGGLYPVVSAGANDDRITYGVKSNPQDSVTAYLYQTNASDNKGFIHKAHGLRGGFTLELTAEERAFFTPDAIGSAYARTPHTSSRSSLGLPTFDFSTAPIVGGGFGCSIKAVTAGESYPDAGRVVSFTYNRSGQQVQRGVCGQKSAVIPGEAQTATLDLEVADYSDFDPWQYQGQDNATLALPDALLIQMYTTGFTFNDAGERVSGSGDYILTRGYFYITNVEMGSDAGALTYSLSLQSAYAPGTLAGQLPGDSIFSVAFGTYTP